MERFINHSFQQISWFSTNNLKMRHLCEIFEVFAWYIKCCLFHNLQCVFNVVTCWECCQLPIFWLSGHLLLWWNYLFKFWRLETIDIWLCCFKQIQYCLYLIIQSLLNMNIHFLQLDDSSPPYNQTIPELLLNLNKFTGLNKNILILLFALFTFLIHFS